MITRKAQTKLISLSRSYPVVTVVGPRQSGKTTMVKQAFPHYNYFNLEEPDVREKFLADPRNFLKESSKGIILDEIQKAPVLLSYIQGLVDTSRKNGKIILTGSHQLEIMNTISQSLAGRTAIMKLLPFTLEEAKKLNPDLTLNEWINHGFYPRVHQEHQNPYKAYRNYFETYIERDVRKILNIKEISRFERFIRLCAGRIGEIFVAAHLSNDLGVSIHTVQSWLSILEASFITYSLKPWNENIGKRLLKSPKIYFYDTGLASYLLGLETASQTDKDPRRGHLFENMVIMELIKSRFNQGMDPNLFYYRDHHGNEVDVVFQKGHELIPMEIKSSSTFHSDYLKSIVYFKNLLPSRVNKSFLVYSGEKKEQIAETILLPFQKTHTAIE